MSKISNIDLKRFSRQIILKNVGVYGQKKILKSRVLIIGLGGLGCPLTLYLANSGVKNFGFVDSDKVEISNLSRQILYSFNDIGKLKVFRAKKNMLKYFKNLKIKIYNSKINPSNIKNIFKQYDIICDGTDNFETRYLINDYCKKYKKILISAAIKKNDGHLFKFNFKKKSPCLRCFMPEIPINNSCDEEGILSTTAGILGTLQANEVIKTILNVERDLAGNMLIFRGQENFLKKIKINVNPKCINKC